MDAPDAIVYSSGETTKVTFTWEPASSKRELVWGAYYEHDELIKVRRGQTKYSERETVLHEIMHDAAARSGLRKIVPKKIEEIVITLISPWLLEALLHTPGLPEYLSNLEE